MIQVKIITVSNDAELQLLDKSTIPEGALIVVQFPKPTKSYIYHNEKFVRLMNFG